MVRDELVTLYQGMNVDICPVCGEKTTVYKTYVEELWELKRRYKTCPKCGYSFQTVEVPIAAPAFGTPKLMERIIDKAKREAALEERKKMIKTIEELMLTCDIREPRHHKDLLRKVYKAIGERMSEENAV